MELTKIIAKFRSDSDDKVEPYLSSRQDAVAWLNEAEEEAALRADLLFDSTTAAVCSIDVTAGTSTYDLHESVFRVTKAWYTADGSDESYELRLIDRTELDRIDPTWRDLTDVPTRMILDDTAIQLDRLPTDDGTIALEVFRGPLVAIEDSTTETPEIGRAHHRHLVQWMLHRCYSRPDSQIYDPDRSARALAEFTRVFGERPDAKLRKDAEMNRPHFNKAW